MVKCNDFAGKMKGFESAQSRARFIVPVTEQTFARGAALSCVRGRPLENLGWNTG
jgi:hypothetical protein